MAYTRGTNANIIVGAAAMFTHNSGELLEATLPAYVDDESYNDTLHDDSAFTNVGYTMNGLGNCFPA